MENNPAYIARMGALERALGRAGCLLLGGGKTNIILNLREMPYVDSSGIGELISVFVAVRREGGRMMLVGLSKRVREVLQMVKLWTAGNL
jgi:anti-anti-sigma factor